MEELGSESSDVNGENCATGDTDEPDVPLNEGNYKIIQEILDHIQKSPAVFRSQQIGDPELTQSDKREIAEDLLKKSHINFLSKFGQFLLENHLDYFSSTNDCYEVQYHIKQLRVLLNDNKKKLMKRNRRFEALKRLEAQGSYFSEAEMEKREPLLYHQLVGQFLSEKERSEKRTKDAAKDEVIPTFSNFLIHKMEMDEVDDLRKSQQEAEDSLNNQTSSDDENSNHSMEEQEVEAPRWGDDWIDAEKKKQKKNFKKKKEKKIHLSSKEKGLLLDEFRTIMQSKFLNGMDLDFDYTAVDTNPEYDCLQVRSQDEEEKYFDEETCDNDVCTDTGIEDY